MIEQSTQHALPSTVFAVRAMPSGMARRMSALSSCDILAQWDLHASGDVRSTSRSSLRGAALPRDVRSPSPASGKLRRRGSARP